MSTPTTNQTGIPVTLIFDGTNSGNTPVPVITSADTDMDVKYVPTPGAADDK